MSKPVLEDVDDIDNMDMDIAQFDPHLRTPIAPLHPGQAPLNEGHAPRGAPQEPDLEDTNRLSAEDRAALRKYQMVYPCYFDKNRSHSQGRRVSKDLAVENPLAHTISDACRHLLIPVMLELDKTHPQDFGNVGRVRVLLKENGKPANIRFDTKRALLNAIAKYLKDHPTTLESIGKRSGVPIPREYQEGFEASEVAVPKGFKMNSIVPVHLQVTMRHPMTKLIYDPLPEVVETKPKVPKAPKKKIMRVRG